MNIKELINDEKLQDELLSLNKELLTLINWYNISSNILTKNFIRKFKNHLDFGILFCYNKFSEDEIIEFSEFYNNPNIGTILATQKLSYKTIMFLYSKITKQKKAFWISVSQFQKLSQKNILKLRKYLNPTLISECQKLSEKFIIQNKKWIDFSYIGSKTKFSIEFIEKYFDKLDFNFVMLNNKLPEYILEKVISSNKNYIDYYVISISQDLSENFIEKYFDKFHHSNIAICQNMSLDFIKRNIDKFIVEDLFENKLFSIEKKEQIRQIYAQYSDLI